MDAEGVVVNAPAKMVWSYGTGDITMVGANGLHRSGGGRKRCVTRNAKTITKNLSP
jgi:hypothetical protein